MRLKERPAQAKQKASWGSPRSQPTMNGGTTLGLAARPQLGIRKLHLPGIFFVHIYPSEPWLNKAVSVLMENS